MMRDIVWDIECYPNFFCVTFYDPKTGNHITFEVSEFVDQWKEFVAFVEKCSKNFTRWVGFNNYYC